MKKNKNGITTFKTNIRIPIGQKDNQFEDTNNELTENPKIHVKQKKIYMNNIYNLFFFSNIPIVLNHRNSKTSYK